MTSLQLILLGGFQARAAGKEIDVPGRKERALLALLAIPAGESRSRDKVAGLLWSDRGDSQARDSLKQAIFKLRKSLDGVQPSPLLADREFVSLERAAVAVDVAEFEQLIGEDTMESLARATTLYRGDLLDGLDLRDAAFDEWLLMERERLRHLAREALAKLLDRHMTGGAHDQAGDAARRLLSLDPLREVAHRALMQIYAARGQTALALKQYQLCRDALQSELGVRPEAETERLHRAIQEKRATASRALERPAAATAVPEASASRGRSSPAKQGEPAAPSARPTIAALPFANFNADPEQEYFSDGITEDIITELSRHHSLTVIARNSCFQFRGPSVDIHAVRQALGVRYILQGSVRKGGNRVRITAQLIDALEGIHLWADRYDGVIDDVFELQDRIAERVVGIVAPTILSAEIKRARRKRPGDLTAYDYVLQSLPHWWATEAAANAEALRLLQKAIESDPTYALAHALASRLHGRSVVHNWASRPEEAKAEALSLARTALALDNEDPTVLVAVCAAETLVGDLISAAAHIEEALARNPNSAEAWQWSGWVYAYQGEADVAIEHFTRAARLNPFDPHKVTISWGIGTAHFVAGRHEEALTWLERALSEHPNVVVINRLLSASYALAGRPQEARRCLRALCMAVPGLTVSKILATHPFRPPEIQARLAEGLRKAGLQE